MRKFQVMALAVLALGGLSAHAATLGSSTFTSTRILDGVANTVDVDVTGANVVDWGYYEKVSDFFSSPTFDNSKAVSGIGAVTATPGTVSNATVGYVVNQTFTFDDGAGPAAGTVGIGAGLGAWGPTEDNAGTFTFNDLGAGTHTVRLYVGHSSATRIFDMDYTVVAAAGGFVGNTISNATAGGGRLQSVYEIVFSTTDAAADLSLQFNSTSGGTGSGWVGGYVVETVRDDAGDDAPVTPEPGTFLLAGLGGLALLRRRRA